MCSIVLDSQTDLCALAFVIVVGSVSSVGGSSNPRFFSYHSNFGSTPLLCVCFGSVGVVIGAKFLPFAFSTIP